MKNIVKITIKSSTEYPYADAYRDELIIGTDFISYQYEATFNAQKRPQKWSYSTNNPVFKEWFKLVAEQAYNDVHKEPGGIVLDDGWLLADEGITLIVEYEDKSSEKKEIGLDKEYFKKLFIKVRIMIPTSEAPEILK